MIACEGSATFAASVPNTPFARTIAVLPGEMLSAAGSARIGTGVGVGVGVAGTNVPGVAGAVSSGGGVGNADGAGGFIGPLGTGTGGFCCARTMPAAQKQEI